MQDSVSVVIPVAGIGSRMGLDRPKALLNIGGESLLERHLRIIGAEAEIFVVGGFNVASVFEELVRLESSAVLIINHNFSTTGTAGSVSRTADFLTSGRVLLLDGDLLVSEETMREFISFPRSALGIGPVRSQEPVYAHLDPATGMVEDLSQKEKSDWEWSGLALVSRENCKSFGEAHVFESLKSALPLQPILSDWYEIDFPADLEGAKQWVKKWRVSE